MKKSVYTTLTPNGTYRIRYIDEAGCWWSKTFKNKTEAQIFERAVKKGESLEQWFPNKDENKVHGTFQDLALQWLDHAEHVRELSEACLSNYRCHLKHHILPVHGALSLETLSLSDVEKLAKILKGKKPQTFSYKAVRKNLSEGLLEDGSYLSVGYRREILIVACMITKWAMDRHFMSTNPFEKYKLPEKTEQPKQNIVKETPTKETPIAKAPVKETAKPVPAPDNILPPGTYLKSFNTE